MKTPASIALLSALLLAGCTTLPRLTEQLDAAKPSYTDFSQVGFNSLPPEGEANFELNESSSVFNFDVGKSYFTGYSLPPNAEGKFLEVKATPTGSIAFESAKLSQLYCPRVLFLDQHKKPLEAMEIPGLFIPGSGFGGWRIGAISSFKIPSGATYAVLHSNPATFGQFRYSYTTSSAYLVGRTFVFNRGGEQISYQCAPIADARVRISNKAVNALPSAKHAAVPATVSN